MVAAVGFDPTATLQALRARWGPRGVGPPTDRGFNLGQDNKNETQCEAAVTGMSREEVRLRASAPIKLAVCARVLRCD